MIATTTSSSTRVNPLLLRFMGQVSYRTELRIDEPELVITCGNETGPKDEAPITAQGGGGRIRQGQVRALGLIPSRAQEFECPLKRPLGT
jgi:hypothetical protein